MWINFDQFTRLTISAILGTQLTLDLINSVYRCILVCYDTIIKNNDGLESFV